MFATFIEVEIGAQASPLGDIFTSVCVERYIDNFSMEFLVGEPHCCGLGLFCRPAFVTPDETHTNSQKQEAFPGISTLTKQ